MIADLKPYPDYRDSGLPWLGKVPGHWDKRRMKFLFRERAEKGFPEEPLLAATQTKGVIRKEDYGTRTVTATKDLHLLKLVEEGDFVISLRSFQGGIELAHARGIISPAYTILEPRRDAARGYYAQFFKSPYFIQSMTLFVTGIREGQNIDYERLGRAYLPLPPPPEQAAIVRFLTWANGRLERAIRAKRKVIALLNEQKEAIIHRAVTRGLDPSVPLKPSGIPWLGEIPAHWEVRRFKSLVTEAVAGPYGSSLTKAMYVTAGYRVYGQQQVITDNFEVGDYYISSEQFLSMQRYRVFPGDVLVSVMGTVGRVAVVPPSAEEGIINPRLVRYRPDITSVRSRWIQVAIQDRAAQAQLFQSAKGTTMDGLNLRILGKLLIVTPPLEEQDAVLSNISERQRPFTDSISRLTREIDLLHEYRTRLVSDVVTGKLDVRAVAAGLPEEVLEEEAVEPSELEAEDEEAVG